MEIGQEFTVKEKRDFREGEGEGILVARYLPGPNMTYRVTEKNKAFVESLVNEGVAILGGNIRAPASGMNAEAAGGSTSGALDTTAGKKRK